MVTKWFKLVIFKDGKRIEKRVPRSKLPELMRIYKELKDRGTRCCVVGITEKRRYPPPHSIAENRDEGKLWCPYCGDWRYYKIPRAYSNPEPLSREWFMNVYRNNETRICSWCEISVKDWYVCAANNIHSEVWDGPRRRRTKKGVRKRVSRRGQRSLM